MNIISRKSLATLVLSSAALLGLSGTANAATYEYTGVVTLCTDTCLSFDSLDAGTIITGSYDIDTTAGGSFSFADVSQSFAVEVFNPGLPTVPFDGTNPTTANPLPMNDLIAPIVENSGAAGGNLVTGGTTDANNELNGGTILHEFIVEPFNNNAAWVVFDLASGNAQVCILYTLLGCVPVATEIAVIEGSWSLASTAVPVPAAAWLLGSALFGLLGLRRRA